MKGKLKIVLPIILVVVVIGFVWWVTEPRDEIITPSGDIVKKPVNEVNIQNIDTDTVGVSDMVKIDEDNYILISRDFAKDENDVPMPGVYQHSYSIYSYNADTGLKQMQYNIDEYFQIAGIDKEKKIMYLAVTNLEIPEGSVESPYNIVKVNYETMQVVQEITDKSNFYNCIISEDSSIWTYLIDKDIYVSGNNFENERLLLSANGNQMYNLLEISNTKVIYNFYDEDASSKIMMIDINDNTNTQLLEDVFYIDFDKDKNELYYMQREIMNEVFKINIDSLDKSSAIEFDQNEGTVNNIVTLSDDMKLLAVIEITYVNGLEDCMIKLYDLNTKKLIASYDSEQTGIISNIQFMNNYILFTQNDKIYQWDYLMKQ